MKFHTLFYRHSTFPLIISHYIQSFSSFRHAHICCSLSPYTKLFPSFLLFINLTIQSSPICSLPFTFAINNLTPYEAFPSFSHLLSVSFIFSISYLSLLTLSQFLSTCSLLHSHLLVTVSLSVYTFLPLLYNIKGLSRIKQRRRSTRYSPRTHTEDKRSPQEYIYKLAMYLDVPLWKGC